MPVTLVTGLRAVTAGREGVWRADSRTKVISFARLTNGARCYRARVSSCVSAICKIDPASRRGVMPASVPRQQGRDVPMTENNIRRSCCSKATQSGPAKTPGTTAPAAGCCCGVDCRCESCACAGGTTCHCGAPARA
jgi:hypothetical protein